MNAYDLGSTPIPGESPAGIDAKYEPEYGIVSEEIGKLGSATRGGAIVWSTVAEQGQILLEQKSKDFQIAAYVGVAWQETQGPVGLCDAATLFCALLDHFWETGFPPLAKLRRRTNAFAWWHENAYAALQKYTGNALPDSLITTLENNLKTLDRLVEERMPDAMPLRDLLEAVRRLPVEAPVPEVPSETESPQEAPPKTTETPRPQETPPKQPETPKPQEPPASENVEDFATLASAFAGLAVRYALKAHQENAEDPVPWQILRIAQWGKVHQCPPAEDSQTHIPPPDRDRLEGLERMFAAGKYRDVALACEEIFPVSLFCLDIQHLVDRALFALGEPFAGARSRVREETARFVQRLHGVEELTFNDGTPFANPETRQWLDSLAHNETATPLSPFQGIADTPLGGVLAKRLAEAERLCANQQIGDALRVLEEGMSNSPSANMALRVHQLRLVCTAKERDIAYAMAQGLWDELEERRVAEWDIDLAVDALLAVRSAFTLAKDKERALGAQNKIARLRPSAALGWK
ncbi:MAG: type VI secretion system protein TssA [Desulfovibrio sp.]|nr:type VI secretion system protein TssA [Desulfovibrio sp.]